MSLLRFAKDLKGTGKWKSRSKRPDSFPLLLYLNPANIFRILNVFGFEDVRKLYGLATVLTANLANPWLLGSAKPQGH